MRAWISLALVAVLVLGTSQVGPVSAQDGGANLLQNADFEWAAPWPVQDKYFPIAVATGWHAWWLPTPPKEIPKPSNCQGKSDNGCYWAVPEFTDVQKAAHANRVYSGTQAQKYFTYGRMHQAGLWQQVGGIPPGSRLRFSIYVQAWMCYQYVEGCKGGLVSDHPSNMHLMIGLDPTGGDKPWGPDVVWSPEQAAWDHWVLFQVEAVARSSTVTVFTHSRVDWDWARQNNDVYLDNASLVVVGQTPAAQATTPLKPQQPAPPTQTARPQATQPLPPTVTPARSPTPSVTPTPTDTAAPTETPVRRVATLPPEDTPAPSLAGRLGDSPGSLIGLAFLGLAGFLGALVAGALLGRRSRRAAG